MVRLLCWSPRMRRFFQELINFLINDEILFGSPRWLENFKKIKQEAIGLLYKDYLNNGWRYVLISTC